MSITLAKEVLQIEANGILAMVDRLDHNFEHAVAMIMDCPSRVIITGIGKSGIIGQKIAATLNSTGTSSFFLHPVEAMHGDLGLVSPDDVILAISNSGETPELTMLLPSFKKRGNRLIAMTGNRESTLAKTSDAVLNVGVEREACPMGLAPTASTTATLAMGDALAVVLLNRKQFKESDFLRNHPGGSLGERLKIRVEEVMLTGTRIPTISPDTLFSEALVELNEKNIGAVLVVSHEKYILGILTDGDIRRLVVKSAAIFARPTGELMTPNPKTIQADLLAADALSIMQRHEVTILPVVDHDQRLIGILHLHDLLGKGEFRVLI
ncbi:MAG: KpsF/GutQ family sugar-phosphate isomerase [Proteobacteria bacterium]|nr:KpsF/GutQ family sugar-phosphate isomerase [Desulfobulbaceae bacterium]MBU4151739.1 KpsF/GutQ family sugar-phosphate isomerase [Pseudomonadota bacterium]